MSYRTALLTCVTLLLITGTLTFAQTAAPKSGDGNAVDASASADTPAAKSNIDGCPDNCSGQGLCGPKGECLCLDGYAGADCSRQVCPAACSVHGECIHGVCKCKYGWVGYDCSFRGCVDNCNNRGSCHISKDFSKCTCFPGYSGPACENQVAKNVPAPCKNGCSGNGMCVAGECKCLGGFAGDFCEQHVCKNNCYGRGLCDTRSGKCLCINAEKYAGANCEIEKCPHDCFGHGKCSKASGKCVCDAGFYGADCNPENCLDNCHNNGKCITSRTRTSKPTCQCNPFFSGATCGTRQCPLNCSNGNGTCDTNTWTCKCNKGYFGLGCDRKICLNKCVNGTCMDGKCVCDPDFQGKTCSVPKKCPSDCNRNGKCKAGKCYCDPKFIGESCGVDVSKPIPVPTIKVVGNPGQRNCNPVCSFNGRCVYQWGKPRCICRKGYWGPSCSNNGPKPSSDATDASKTQTNSASAAGGGVNKGGNKAKAVNADAAEANAGKTAADMLAVTALANLAAAANEVKKSKSHVAGKKLQCEIDCGLNGLCMEFNGKRACNCDAGYFGADCSIATPVSKTSLSADAKASLAAAAAASNKKAGLIEIEDDTTSSSSSSVQHPVVAGQLIEAVADAHSNSHAHAEGLITENENSQHLSLITENSQHLSLSQSAGLEQLRQLQQQQQAHQVELEQHDAAVLQQLQMRGNGKSASEKKRLENAEEMEEEKQRQLEEERREDAQLMNALDQLTGDAIL